MAKDKKSRTQRIRTYNYKNISGRKFGLVLAISFSHVQNGKVRWNCLCSCGREIIVTYSNLMSGNTTSCGCKNKNTPNGMGKHPLYQIWCSMKKRCTNKNQPSYRYYGGRGITVCNEWIHDFPSFLEWSLTNGWNKGLQIDRINNNGNYEPSNCRWATIKEQARNRRSSRLNIIKASIIRKLHSEYGESINNIVSIIGTNYHSIWRILHSKSWT